MIFNKLVLCFISTTSMLLFGCADDAKEKIKTAKQDEKSTNQAACGNSTEVVSGVLKNYNKKDCVIDKNTGLITSMTIGGVGLKNTVESFNNLSLARKAKGLNELKITVGSNDSPQTAVVWKKDTEGIGKDGTYVVTAEFNIDPNSFDVNNRLVEVMTLGGETFNLKKMNETLKTKTGLTDASTKTLSATTTQIFVSDSTFKHDNNDITDNPDTGEDVIGLFFPFQQLATESKKIKAIGNSDTDTKLRTHVNIVSTTDLTDINGLVNEFVVDGTDAKKAKINFTSSDLFLQTLCKISTACSNHNLIYKLSDFPSFCNSLPSLAAVVIFDIFPSKFKDVPPVDAAKDKSLIEAVSKFVDPLKTDPKSTIKQFAFSYLRTNKLDEQSNAAFITYNINKSTAFGFAGYDSSKDGKSFAFKAQHFVYNSLFFQLSGGYVNDLQSNNEHMKYLNDNKILLSTISVGFNKSTSIVSFGGSLAAVFAIKQDNRGSYNGFLYKVKGYNNHDFAASFNSCVNLGKKISFSTIASFTGRSGYDLSLSAKI